MNVSCMMLYCFGLVTIAFAAALAGSENMNIGALFATAVSGLGLCGFAGVLAICTAITKHRET